CELVPLHLNIKACVYQTTGADESVLSVFTGNKAYTPIAKAKRNDYMLRVQTANASYLHLQVVSESGPLDTSDYRLQFEAIPIDGSRTFARVSFSYRYGAMTRMLSAAYFGTVARSKIGFSIVGQDEHGEPIYLRGRAAALERNVMRLYLALQTLLESHARPEPERFEWSIRRWHALTERYPRQLNEIQQTEYLDIKRREHAEPPPHPHELWPTPS
ncbi:MAG TPA: hypothetical protein VES91_03415, partial [Burkholderiaceae bacterium]|nr:hypothetical protein [Burkholderiaceae bacterium]